MNVSVADLVCFGSEFLWNTLLRNSQLAVEHVDLERGLLFLPDSKSGRKTIILNALL